MIDYSTIHSPPHNFINPSLQISKMISDGGIRQHDTDDRKKIGSSHDPIGLEKYNWHVDNDLMWQSVI